LFLGRCYPSYNLKRQHVSFSLGFHFLLRRGLHSSWPFLPGRHSAIGVADLLSAFAVGGVSSHECDERTDKKLGADRLLNVSGAHGPCLGSLESAAVLFSVTQFCEQRVTHPAISFRRRSRLVQGFIATGNGSLGGRVAVSVGCLLFPWPCAACQTVVHLVIRLYIALLSLSMAAASASQTQQAAPRSPVVRPPEAA